MSYAERFCCRSAFILFVLITFVAGGATAAAAVATAALVFYLSVNQPAEHSDYRNRNYN